MIVHPTRDESERVHPRSPSSVATIPLGDLRGVHVLAVDDDADALSLLSELLDAAGAEVRRLGLQKKPSANSIPTRRAFSSQILVCRTSMVFS